MARNTHCWVPDPDECYVVAKIVSDAGKKLTVKAGRDGSGAQKSVDTASTLPIEDITNIDNLEEDLVQMECVHEASILHNLRARFMEDHIYSALGRHALPLPPPLFYSDRSNILHHFPSTH